MTQRASESLVAVLIRIGLLLALAILLMAENAQAQTRIQEQAIRTPQYHACSVPSPLPAAAVAA